MERALSPDKILFIPSISMQIKGSARGVARGSIFMLQLALEGRSGWEVSDIEYKRRRPPTPFIPWKNLRRCTKTPNSILYAVPTSYTIHTWREPYRLFNCVNLPSFKDRVIPPKNFGTGGQGKKEYDGHIKVIECDQLDISSSDIRQRLSRGADVAGMLPERVLEYIKEKGLYKASV